MRNAMVRALWISIPAPDRKIALFVFARGDLPTDREVFAHDPITLDETLIGLLIDTAQLGELDYPVVVDLYIYYDQ
jgi:hypothetical protein